MTIGPELEARILRYHHVEKWRINTIARQLHVHHSTVARVLAHAGLPVPRIIRRPSAIDPYVSFILETLGQFPTLSAARLYGMVHERGYRGAPDHFRHRIALLRPRPSAEAFLRLRTLPGEVMQCDWAHFGHLDIGRARRPLMAFVMVLGYSRRLYLRFFPDARMASFLAGHVGAFAAFGGCSRVILYDNLKSAVLERRGDAIRFNPTLLAFAAHHRFEPRPVAVARGNEKGRVERAIRHVRDAFFAARAFTGLDDLNAQAAAWCAGPASDRPWPEDRTLTVRQAFQAEQPLLLALPDNPHPCHERTEVAIGKTPYARFDLNDYSVPHTHVRRTLTVLADTEQVRLVDEDGITVLASHPRSYDRDQRIEDPAHVQALVDDKRAARQHRATDVLVQAVPPIQDLLIAAGARGYNLGSVTAALVRLRQQCTARELHVAVLDALARDVPHPNAVRLALARHRDERGLAAANVVTLPEHLQQRDVTVTAHRLDTYDQLTEHNEDPHGPSGIDIDPTSRKT